MSRLSDELRKANTENLGVRDISRRAKDFGETLSPSNISNYLRGNHPERPPEKTLVAFAKVFDVPVSDLQEAATFTGREPFTPDPSADRLTPPQRAVLNELIRVMTDTREKAGEGNADSSPSMNQAGGKPATGEDDGLGAFGHRDRGDLDHDNINDGNGDNVRQMWPDLDTMAADTTGETIKQKLDKEAADRGEEDQTPPDDD